MVKEAEAKCTQMLNDANAAAAQNAKNADAMIAEENARVEEAKRAAAAKIAEIEEQMKSCIQALERIREANRPAPVKEAPTAPTFYDYDQEPDKSAPPAIDPTDALADEIASNLEALVGTTEDTAPKAEPRHPVNDTTSKKFENLQFGRNYDPTHK